MRILFVDQIAKVNYKYSYSLAEAIKSEGNEVVLAVDQKKEPEHCTCKIVRLFNTDEKNINKIEKFRNYIKSYKKIIKEISKGKYDIIQTQWVIFSPLDYYFLKKIKKIGIKHIVTIHDILPFNQKFYHKDRYTDWWIQGYTCGNLFMRLNCAKCLYKQLPRQSDLSFGDFWEIEGCSDADMQKGISVVFLNNDKGKYLIEASRDRLHIEERELKEVLKGNPYLFGQASQNGDRTRFFELLNTEKFSTAVKKTYTETCTKRIKRYVKLIMKICFKRKKW